LKRADIKVDLACGDELKTSYRVKRFDVLMKKDQAKFMQFLNSPEVEEV